MPQAEGPSVLAEPALVSSGSCLQRTATVARTEPDGKVGCLRECSKRCQSRWQIVLAAGEPSGRKAKDEVHQSRCASRREAFEFASLATRRIEQSFDVLIFGCIKQLMRSADLQQASFAHHGDAIAEHQRLRNVMCHQHADKVKLPFNIDERLLKSISR